MTLCFRDCSWLPHGSPSATDKSKYKKMEKLLSRSLFIRRFAVKSPVREPLVCGVRCKKFFRAHKPNFRTCPKFGLHSVGMCGSLVRHANRHLRCMPLHRLSFRCFAASISALYFRGFARALDSSQQAARCIKKIV